MHFTLPSLEYSYDSLEPYIDTETMILHHTKHHQTYINNVNNTLNTLNKFTYLPIDILIQEISSFPTNIQKKIQNNAGGHFNHTLFWKILKKNTSINPHFKTTIENNFHSIDQFKKIFEDTAMSHFGSGWVWLVNQNNKLSIVTTQNQDNPLMGINISGTFGFPIIGLDLWEHAYYLKYQNRKLDYISAFWNIINWDEADIRLNQSINYENHNI